MGLFDNIFDDPLKLALLAGAVGLTGGMAAPAVLGAEAGAGLLGAEAAAGLAGTEAGLLGGGLGASTAASGLGMGTAVPGLGIGSAAPSLLGEGMALSASGTPAQIAGAAAPSMFDTAMGYVKPVGQAMSAANSAKSLFAPPPPPPMLGPSPINMTPSTGPGSLSQLVGANNQAGQFIDQQQEADKARRMALISRIGGRYGTS
jgi:hypothetical protein